MYEVYTTRLCIQGKYFQGGYSLYSLQVNGICKEHIMPKIETFWTAKIRNWHYCGPGRAVLL
jgi:hypothetical protein